MDFLRSLDLGTNARWNDLQSRVMYHATYVTHERWNRKSFSSRIQRAAAVLGDNLLIGNIPSEIGLLSRLNDLVLCKWTRAQMETKTSSYESHHLLRLLT